MQHKNFLLLLLGILLFATINLVFAAELGQKMENVKIFDAENNPAEIPDLGKKVVFIIYSDADVADMNDPLSDKMKAANLSKETLRSMGIANLKDSKAPNFLIRSIIRGKIKKYETTILTDKNKTVAKAWNFGDCNNQSVVVVIGKDQTLKYYYKGAVSGDEIDKVVNLVKAEMQK